MDELVEKIARALWNTHDGSKRYPWETLGDYDREPYAAHARAALTAISSSTTHRVVPVEPTEEMRDAGEAAGWPEGGKSSIEMQWSAMLAASPKVTGSV